MLNPDDLVVVALSGGKDSITLLDNLIKVQEKTFNSKELIAITVDEGIDKFCDEWISIAKEFCNIHKIEHHIISFKDEFGLSLNEIIDLITNNSDSLYACNYCATIRRRILNDYAKKLGATKLALGHNLTDFAETFLMNILHKRIKLIGNRYPLRSEKTSLSYFFVRKVFPLMRIPEDEIEFYVNLKNYNYYPKHCPYREKDPILRKRVLQFIHKTKKMSPEVEFNLFNSFLEISELIYYNKNNKSYKKCEKCGYPSGNKDLCTYCFLKNLTEP